MKFTATLQFTMDIVAKDMATAKQLMSHEEVWFDVGGAGIKEGSYSYKSRDTKVIDIKRAIKRKV